MRFVWCLALAVLMVGCVPGGSTANGSALVHPNFPYAVSYDDPATKSVMGDEWKLETYRRKKQRTPDAPIELERKNGFLAKYWFDFDDDDKADATAKLPIPDLQFVNKRTDAKLEVVTFLLDVKLASKELRLLLKDIVDSGSGTRALFVGFGRKTNGVEKRYATRLVDSQEASLGGQTGLVATLEHADLDQLELNPNARSRRTRLFLMRAPFDYVVRESGGGSSNAASYHPYKVLLLAEYSNAPEDFDVQYPEFLRLMSKLHLVGDVRMLAFLQEVLAPCARDGGAASLSLEISATGQATVKAASGLEQLCASNVVKPYPFAATGQPRLISGNYDFSKPFARPSWLAQSEYVEVAKLAPARTVEPAPAAPLPAESDVPPTAPASDTSPPTTAPSPAKGAP